MIIIIIVLLHKVNHKIYTASVRQIIKYKLIAVSGVCYSSMLRVYTCAFYFISMLFAYMCVRMPLSSRSIAGMRSGRALPGFPITAHHL